MHRLVALTLCAASLLLILTGYLLYARPDLLGICAPGTYCLSDRVFYGIAEPLYLYLRPLPALFLLTTFLPSELFYSWVKFFAAVLVIPLVLVIGSEPVSQSFFPGFPDRPQMTELMVKFVTLASLVYIGCAGALRHWKRNQHVR